MIRLSVKAIVSNLILESGHGPMILEEVKDTLRKRLATDLFKHHDLDYTEFHRPSVGGTDVYTQTFAFSTAETDAIRRFMSAMSAAEGETVVETAHALYTVLERETKRLRAEERPVPDTTSPEAKRLLDAVESADTRREEP